MQSIISTVCSECSIRPIPGPFYKCTIRRNFTLCNDCESVREQPFPMMKIYNHDHVQLPIIEGFCKEVDRDPAPWTYEKSIIDSKQGQSIEEFFSKLDKAASRPNKIPLSQKLSDSKDSFKSVVSQQLEIEFHDDVTYPDGTITSPGAVFVKIWRVYNPGANTWPSDLYLISIDADDGTLSPSYSDMKGEYDLDNHNSDDLANTYKIALPRLEPGKYHDISVTIKAPSYAGPYFKAFQFIHNGNILEDQTNLWVDIDVQEERGWEAMSGIIKSNGRFFVTPDVSRQVSNSST